MNLSQSTVVLVLRVLSAHKAALCGIAKANDLRDRVAQILGRSGWCATTEVRVPDRGDGRPGRIDIVLARAGGHPEVAIELDCKTPRAKSLFKVRNHPAPGKLVLLRDGDRNGAVDGVRVMSVRRLP